MLATLNVDTKRHAYTCVQPDHVMPQFDWLAGVKSTGVSPSWKEDFVFTKITLQYDHKDHDAILYHIDNKADCPHGPAVWEIVAEPVHGVEYGDELTIVIDPNRIKLHDIATGSDDGTMMREAA